MIAPILIACKERYAKLATVAIETYLKYHNTPLYVVVDATGEKLLSGFVSENLCLVSVKKYREEVIESVNMKNFYVFRYDKDGDHDRVYSSLKPLIMNKVIADLAPQSRYILSLDADALFSGNILDKVALELNKIKHKYDLYMVLRRDRRMLQTKGKSPGSGFTLWKKESVFIPFFLKRYNEVDAGRKGGSQNLTNAIRGKMPSMLFTDPLLHMVSPDLRNPRLTDQEILKMKPAYIHLHGENSYKRLLRFKAVFER